MQTWMRASPWPAAEVVQHLESWLHSVQERQPDATFALECIGWSYLLPGLAGVLPAAPWCETLDTLTGLAAKPPHSRSTDHALLNQLYTGELPWTLADQFPELPACRALGRAARRRLGAGLLRCLDDSGLPHFRHLDLVRPLLACWTRCRTLVRADGTTCFSPTAQARFERFVRQAFQLSRQTGLPVFGANGAEARDAQWMDAALPLASSDETSAIADQLLPWRAGSGAARARRVSFPESSVNSESAQLASLRPTWLRGSEHLVIGHDNGVLHSELNCGSTTLWTGRWIVEVSVGDRPLRPAEWKEVCWHSDDDVDYLELETELGDSWRMERQILLARKDRFLWLADAVIGPEVQSLDYRSTVPLARGVGFRAERPTREGFLMHRRRVARVLPLALPEWRTAAGPGSLESADDDLVLRQQVRARGLYAPLFIDLHPQRLRRAVTWRQLTVGERLQIQPPDVAVGYRIQVGGDQWLFYRSLAPPANRSLLGQNVLHEFLAARFNTDGKTDELLAINPVPAA